MEIFSNEIIDTAQLPKFEEVHFTALHPNYWKVLLINLVLLVLISATGTGKTYLSAFDVKVFKPRKFLFVVHRRTIAEKAMETFKNLFEITKYQNKDFFPI